MLVCLKPKYYNLRGKILNWCLLSYPSQGLKCQKYENIINLNLWEYWEILGEKVEKVIDEMKTSQNSYNIGKQKSDKW